MHIRKLHCFTLVELIVAIVISSVVVAISVYVYFNFGRIINDNVARSNTVNMLLSQLYKIDIEFDNASIVEFNNDSITLISQNDSRSYYYVPDLFYQLNQSNGPYIAITNITTLRWQNSKLLRRLSFNIQGQNLDTLSVSFYKVHSPAVLVKYENSIPYEH